MSDKIAMCHICQAKAKYLVASHGYCCGKHLTTMVDIYAPLNHRQITVERLTLTKD
jgi:hypothetical protein